MALTRALGLSRRNGAPGSKPARARPEAQVEALLATIARDDRHTGMMVCERTRVDGRAFGGWSMGWVRASDLARAGFDPGALSLRDSPSALVNAMFEAFRLTVRLS